MSREIERRFLVHPQKLPKLTRGRKITQVYLSNDPVVRVRIKEKKAYLCIKNKRDYLVRDEYEYKIPFKDAQKLTKQSKNKVSKTRYNFRLNGSLWEIDIFEGNNKGLIIAEIELSHRNKKFQKPLWLANEVTEDDRYLNVNLAERPYSAWK